MPLRDHFRPPLAAVVLLLLEVFERRSGVLSRRRRRAAESMRQPRERTNWFSRKRPRPAPPLATPATQPEPPPARRDEVRETIRDENAMVDALRKARERSRGRLECDGLWTRAGETAKKSGSRTANDPGA